jgi:hypothetical protein
MMHHPNVASAAIGVGLAIPAVAEFLAAAVQGNGAAMGKGGPARVAETL